MRMALATAMRAPSRRVHDRLVFVVVAVAVAAVVVFLA